MVVQLIMHANKFCNLLKSGFGDVAWQQHYDIIFDLPYNDLWDLQYCPQMELKTVATIKTKKGKKLTPRSKYRLLILFQ